MRLDVVHTVQCPIQRRLVSLETCRERTFYSHADAKDIKKCCYLVREWVAGYFQNTTEIECSYKEKIAKGK